MVDRPLKALVQTVLTQEDKVRLTELAKQHHHTPSSLVRAVMLDWMQAQGVKESANG